MPFLSWWQVVPELHRLSAWRCCGNISNRSVWLPAVVINGKQQTPQQKYTACIDRTLWCKSARARTDSTELICRGVPYLKYCKFLCNNDQCSFNVLLISWAKSSLHYKTLTHSCFAPAMTDFWATWGQLWTKHLHIVTFLSGCGKPFRK